MSTYEQSRLTPLSLAVLLVQMSAQRRDTDTAAPLYQLLIFVADHPSFASRCRRRCADVVVVAVIGGLETPL